MTSRGRSQQIAISDVFHQISRYASTGTALQNSLSIMPFKSMSVSAKVPIIFSHYHCLYSSTASTNSGNVVKTKRVHFCSGITTLASKMKTTCYTSKWSQLIFIYWILSQSLLSHTVILVGDYIVNSKVWHQNHRPKSSSFQRCMQLRIINLN